MPNQSPSERKSADRLAFEHYLRTGQRLSVAEWRDRHERKFNPYHDDLGRFTFAPGTAGMGSAPPPPRPALRSRQVGTRPAGHAAGQVAPPRTRVAAMPGFPESGRNSWRSSNDLGFIAAADFYNKKYGLKPGDQGFRTPEFLKAWAMRESGGEGNEREFRTDPFQMNNAGDWTRHKQKIAGIRQGQVMTPAASAYGALEWLRDKAIVQDGRQNIVEILSDEEALQEYNTVKRVTRQSGGLPHKVWYAKSILEMARQASDQKK
jgi:hypothetical protein